MRLSQRRRNPAPAAEPASAAASASPGAPPSARPARQLAIGALLFLGSLVLYLANGKTVPFAIGGDSIPNRLIPFSILRYGTVTMDPFREPFARRGGYRWYAQERRDRLVSWYPIGTPIVALPIYAPLYVYLQARGRTSAEQLFAFSEAAEKITASTMTAATVLLVWLGLRRRTSPARASWTAAALATCSLLWPVASQVLWQHTAGALLLATVLLLAPPASPAGRPWWTGVALGLLFVVRPQTALFAVAAVAGLLAWGLRDASPRRRLRTLGWLALGFGLPAIPSLLYTRYYYGDWLGGYSDATGLFSGAHVLEGMSGLLFSPNRGLFVLMPIALVGVVGAWRLLHQPGSDPMLSGLLVGAVLYFALHAATATWAGGWCFGPRYTTEIMPLLATSSTLALSRPRPRGLALAGLALLWSLLMQVCGAWFYPASQWNARMGPDLERAAWDGGHFVPWEDYRAWRQQRADRR